MIKNGFNIPTITDAKIEHQRVLVRVDFDVSLHKNKIADDTRLRQAIPTLAELLKNKNKLILVSKLNRPKQRDDEHSLRHIIPDLKKHLPGYTIQFVEDFLNPECKTIFANQTENDIILLENIRFYPEEKINDPEFAKKLASVADVYVDDAFAMMHRKEASIVGIPKLLPSFAGLLVEKEITQIDRAIKNPKKPFVAIIGGAKISTKIPVLGKLLELADYVMLGGGLANTFFCAEGYNIGKSYCELEEVENAKKFLFLAAQKNTAVVLPTDVIVGNPTNTKHAGKDYRVNEIPEGGSALDIGPETKARFGSIISKARTIIWNGPMGLFENPAYRSGTDFIYYSIAHNPDAISIVGGGDTLNAIQHKHHLDKITHISTGGGAMLEFIENGTLPGIEALRKK
ncbi:MAG TPA: phosphoglycerate kinase [Candidatus Saccharimonadales bacterium]|nr:phosphoglycerate kinase [Candidatus Saccharimonadales bacterium]